MESRGAELLAAVRRRVPGPVKRRVPDSAKRRLRDLMRRMDQRASRDIPAGPPTQEFARCFWRPVQHELMVSWAHRYLDEIEALSGEGLLAAGTKVRAMQPTTCDQSWLDRAQDLADAESTIPIVRSGLLLAVDTLTRVLDART